MTFDGFGVGDEGAGLAARAIFEIDNANHQLVVTLSNISLDDVLIPADVLTGLFFTLMNGTNQVSLTPVSALLTTGSTVVYDPDGQPAGGNVGGEWAYVSPTSSPWHGAAGGISSTGLNLFGQSNFNGPDLAAPTAVNGLQYGILSAGDNVNTGNQGVTGSGGMIKSNIVNGNPNKVSGVQYRLSGLSANATFAPGSLNLQNVGFQYGTSLGEPHICAQGSICGFVPEPSQWALLGLGLFSLVAVRRFAPARAS